ncbi:MAG: MaoC/PaaZ C-terminal domain-containing protein [Pseudodonghicola sp.]
MTLQPQQTPDLRPQPGAAAHMRPRFDRDRLLAWRFPEISHSYEARDSILYALGVGLGRDPTDTAQLRFLFEEDPEFAALPSMALVLANPGFWPRDPETGIDWRQVLLGEQALVLHAPLPRTGRVRSRMRISEILDKGAGVGALIRTERQITDAATGRLLATATAGILARGNGGCGGARGRRAPPPALPRRAPDHLCYLPTLPQAALLYRLSGDTNPLHVVPAAARAAGFERPILHGRCSFGVATHAIVQSCCDMRPERLRSLAVRFVAPVFPGETLRTEIWQDGDRLRFRARAVERDVVVLSDGHATLAPEAAP